MFTWFNDLLTNTSNFMPHGYCYLWQVPLLWLHIVSDAIITLSYFSIPFALFYFVKKRTDLAYRWVYVLFGIFICLCGTTHLFSIWIIWHPDYWLEGFIKLATALVSFATAVLIWPLIPTLLKIPSPQTLQNSEAYLRAIFDATPDTILISNEKGIITMANQQTESLLGYTANELLGQPIEMLVPGNHLEIHPKYRADFAKSGILRRKAGRKVKALLKNGSELDVEITLSVIKTEQGVFFASAIRDITERLQTEFALLENEKLLRTITDNGNTLMFLKNITGQYIHINRHYENLFHISNTNIRSKTDYDIFPKDVADILVKNDQTVIQSGQPIEIEENFLQDDGYHVYLSVKFPVRSITGEIYAICNIATDITERKRIETELHIAAVAFESQEPLIITNAIGIILRINKAFTQSTGYTEQEAVGQKISILKSGRHDLAFYKAMWNEINKTGSWQGEVWDRRKNGEIYPKWLSITAVKDHDNIVTHYVGTHIDITERKAVEQQIKQLAFYDPLTQLPNRRLLHDRLQHNIHTDDRNNKQFALLMLDLDRFKAVNDSLGHLAGDELLQQVASRLTQRLRNTDTIARLGGDEFVILLEDISHSDDAARIAEEIVILLKQPFKLTQAEEVCIGASIGISLYPEHGDRIDTLMDHADAALYLAKSQGRGCFAYFSDDITLAAKKRIALETRLHHAIGRQELRVFFQPQVDINSGLIVGAEALVRWQDSLEGLIPPNRFIPVAEESGLIVELGNWVLRETCRQGKQWLDNGLPPIILAVNVSPQQFRHSNICAVVANILHETNFPANQLELEITETGLMKNQNNATDILNNLRAQGIHLAIDDFGTGYSSLAYLKHFPLDVLKIDKSFIEDIPSNQDDKQIAATIIAMGKILGFKILAEGVETHAQLNFLQEHGCDSYQGYLKSKAVPASEFAELLREQTNNQ